LTFESGTLHAKMIYQLSLRNGFLQANGKNVSLSLTTQYSVIATDCNKHGTLDNHGICQCSLGYAGRSCENCDIGYKKDPAGSCVADGKEQCRPSTCHNAGNCDDSTGTILCHCNEGYNGDHCEMCAEGYFGSDCKKKTECKSCPDSRGTCDFNQGVCKCFTHFSGALCESCAVGFTGTDCQTQEEIDGWSSSLSSIRVAGMVLGIIVITLTIILFAFRALRSRTPRSNQIYLPVTDLEEDDEATEFESNTLSEILDNEPNAEIVDEKSGKLAPKPPMSLLNDDDEFNPRSL